MSLVNSSWRNDRVVFSRAQQAVVEAFFWEFDAMNLPVEAPPPSSHTPGTIASMARDTGHFLTPEQTLAVETKVNVALKGHIQAEYVVTLVRCHEHP